MLLYLRNAAAVAILALSASTTWGDDIDRTMVGAAKPSKDDVIRALYVDLNEVKNAKARGVQPVRRGLAMEIKFNFNSAELNPQAIDTLRPVGEALQELAPQSFVIEGHTDATGSRWYNKRLSERRAAAVKRFLTSEYKIGPELLYSIGKGPDEPLDKNHPTSGLNRRVEIVTRYE